jgi:DNA-binding transcriptional MerR regulator
MLTVYNADELAQAIGVSQRTLYAYLSQGIIPEGRRVGRQVVYSDLQLRYGLLARAFVEGGMGLEAVSKIINQISPNKVQTYAAPLAALVEARVHLQEDLAKATQQLRPAGVDLDLQDMRLEDPVALQARVEVWENQLHRLGRQLEEAFTEVREHVLADATEGSGSTQRNDQSELGSLRREIRMLTETVRDLALILAAQSEEGQEMRAAARAAQRRLLSASEENGVRQ